MKNLVKVLAVIDDQVVVVKQYRPKLDTITIELPGGNVRVGEEPLASAIRELREETGLTSSDLMDLGSYTSSDGSIKVSLFFTNKISSRAYQNLDGDEVIEVEYYPLNVVLENVQSGKWRDVRLSIALAIAITKGLIGDITS